MKQQIHDTILSGINLIHGDCLVEMKNIPDKSIDLILCDLPFGVLNKGNKQSKALQYLMGIYALAYGRIINHM